MMHILQLPPALVLDKATGKYRRKSHEIGPEPLSQHEDAALLAMRAAHKGQNVLDEAEPQAFARFRATANVATYKSARLSQDPIVYRRAGNGADLPMSPVEWDARQALAAFRVRLSKAFQRAPDSALGVSARRVTADARAIRVLNLYERFKARGRSCAALIARELNERVAYVRRILRENVHDGDRQS